MMEFLSENADLIATQAMDLAEFIRDIEKIVNEEDMDADVKIATLKGMFYQRW